VNSLLSMAILLLARSVYLINLLIRCFLVMDSDTLFCRLCGIRMVSAEDLDLLLSNLLKMLTELYVFLMCLVMLF
jgi:hypothetical protein